MAISNVEAARGALLIWYRSSGLQMKGVSFEDAVSHYSDAYPTFIDSFGYSVQLPSVSSDRLRTAMENLGAQGFGRFPSYQGFFDVLANSLPTTLSKLRFEDVKQIAKETVADVGKVAAVGASFYLGVLAIGALVFFSDTLIALRSRRARS